MYENHLIMLRLQSEQTSERGFPGIQISALATESVIECSHLTFFHQEKYCSGWERLSTLWFHCFLPHIQRVDALSLPVLFIVHYSSPPNRQLYSFPPGGVECAQLYKYGENRDCECGLWSWSTLFLLDFILILLPTWPLNYLGEESSFSLFLVHSTNKIWSVKKKGWHFCNRGLFVLVLWFPRLPPL